MALKRHKSLQNYSREHHEELLLVWKIKTGLKSNIESKRIIDYCLHNYEEILSPHMAREEKYILTRLTETDTDRIRIVNDHAMVRIIIDELSKFPENSTQLLTQFASELDDHIRFEERIFFPRLQQEIAIDLLNSMQPAEEELKECTTWHDPFWENKII